MNKIFTLVLSLWCFVAGGTSAAVIQCKNSAGKVVFTDNPRNCAGINGIKVSQSHKNDSFISEIPDLLQTLNDAEFTGDGQQFCAPVSVSNSLVWLEGNREQSYQIALVKKLASSEYMNTSEKNGTDVMGVIHGVNKYALERWGNFKTLEYSGWRPSPAAFKSQQKTPTVNWMTQALHRKGAVWLNLGWYSPEGIDYRRNGGHWVTLVGYENGKLIIHDPSPRAGHNFSNQFLTVSTIQSGELIRGDSRRRAKDFLLVQEGLLNLRQGRVGIIDGAIKFELH